MQDRQLLLPLVVSLCASLFMGAIATYGSFKATESQLTGVVERVTRQGQLLADYSQRLAEVKDSLHQVEQTQSANVANQINALRVEIRQDKMERDEISERRDIQLSAVLQQSAVNNTQIGNLVDGIAGLRSAVEDLNQRIWNMSGNSGRTPDR